MFVAQNPAYVDWWLMQQFPNRTLEELDNVDWPRLQRALEVDRIVETELRRKAYIKAGGEMEVSNDDLRMWEHHDRLVGEDNGGY